MREPLAVTMRSNLARQEASNAALPDGDPRKALNAARIEAARAALPPLPKKRATRMNGVDIDAVHRKQDDTEAPVLRAVGTLLAAHPLVVMAIRQNGGAMEFQNAAGNRYPIWFYRFAKKPQGEFRVTDYWGFLRDGTPWAIECKKPSWNGKCKSDSELGQQAYIRFIEAIGGRAGFARNVEEAAAILP